MSSHNIMISTLKVVFADYGSVGRYNFDAYTMLATTFLCRNKKYNIHSA